MDAAATARLHRLLADNREELTKLWGAAVAASLRGPQSEAELIRQTEGIFSTLLVATQTGEVALAGAASAELRGAG